MDTSRSEYAQSPAADAGVLHMGVAHLHTDESEDTPEDESHMTYVSRVTIRC